MESTLRARWGWWVDLPPGKQYACHQLASAINGALMLLMRLPIRALGPCVWPCHNLFCFGLFFFTETKDYSIFQWSRSGKSRESGRQHNQDLECSWGSEMSSCNERGESVQHEGQTHTTYKPWVGLRPERILVERMAVSANVRLNANQSCDVTDDVTSSLPSALILSGEQEVWAALATMDHHVWPFCFISLASVSHVFPFPTTTIALCARTIFVALRSSP